MKSIALVGMPGCGKSSVGMLLGRRLGRRFEDLDHVLEVSLGCSIRDYFSQRGEDAFREIEAKKLDDLTKNRGAILAMGGGVVLRKINRQRLRERTLVIYLQAGPERLARRLRYDTKRPLLQVLDPLARLQELYAERDPFYREVAHLTVEARDESVSALVDRVIMKLEMSGCLA